MHSLPLFQLWNLSYSPMQWVLSDFKSVGTAFWGGRCALGWGGSEPAWEWRVDWIEPWSLETWFPTLFLFCLALWSWMGWRGGRGEKGPLWTPALSGWAMQGYYWWFPQCLLLEPVDWVPARYPSRYINLLFLDNWEASGTDCPWIWSHRALVADGAGRRIQTPFMLAFLSFQLFLLPALASHFLPLSFSCLYVPFYSALFPSPSRLLIGNHQIVSVTMSSMAAKALVIFPATQSKWLGENGILQLRCKAF